MHLAQGLNLAASIFTAGLLRCTIAGKKELVMSMAIYTLTAVN